MPEYSKAKIMGFSFGNIKDRTSWSGTNFYFYKALKKHFRMSSIISNYSGVHLLKSKSFSKKCFKLNYPVWPTLKKYSNYSLKKFKKGKKSCNLILFLNLVPFFPDNTPFIVYLDAVFQHKLAYKKASVLFTFSNCLRDFFLKKYKIDPERVITVGAGPNFINLPKITKKNYNGKTILFIGSPAYRKGGLVLLKAFKMVRSVIKDARLIMVSSELDSRTNNDVKISLKKSGVFIKGFSSKPTLSLWYRKADLFVLPSFMESFGIVLLEAMAYKLPCISTRKFAMKEIIDEGKTGFLVKPRSPSELANKIIFLLKNPQLSRKMGEAGYRKIIGYYNWDKVVERMLPAIKSILRNKSKKAI
jgi:glycosyltransferase involved in cell wall biosynthesis